jgi:DNA-binding PadR family transcriptional regulator
MESPMSGYDIKKQVNAVLSAATNASYGTLYPTLHKLLKEGAVEMQEVEQRGRPSKKVYRITDQGRRELREWLKQPAAADQIRREFLLKLYLCRLKTS